ncbi:glycosyltransferase family 1 protein [Candidatus Cyanaurora vandensis]|uniref:glycosyltransferase family 4 protein n=1 Tax=Candidatus Cyanaurora vandensis TaxID=2714958 RepID=UPI00257B42A9|nr:glycosyltransferase family 1 protein [Candidatus Cyanaurora vandensis]
MTLSMRPEIKVPARVQPRVTCALISVHGDPAAEIGKEGAGGQNIYVREVGLALARLGYEVDMFTRLEHPDQAPVVHHAPGCRTIRLEAGPMEFIDRMDLYPYLPAFAQAFLDFRQQQGRDYQVIHTHYWDSAQVGLLLREEISTPIVHTYHSLGSVKYQRTNEWHENASLRLAVEHEILESADCIIATSPQEEEDMRRLVSQRGRVRVIPCGTDTERFGLLNRAQARQQLGIAENKRIVLYAGRFDERKGIETLVRACAPWREDPDFQLYLVGGSRADGPDARERERIEGIVRELGLENITTFTGRLSQTDLAQYYTAAQVCVVPSHYEPFGLVAIEAMACATPVIASDVGGLRYTVQPGRTGELVPPRNPQALTQALTRVFAQPQQWADYGQAARQQVEARFSWSGVARQLQKLYASLAIVTS